jgi:glycosyltransferase involved in cell wall biosynthesis
MGGLYANEVIVISTVIGDIVRKRCKRESNLIFNGVPLPDKSTRSDFLDSFGIRPQQYILAVARFVPEKGLHDLVEAFRGVHGDCQLVIAGDADHETAYSRKLRNMAAQDERIILTGYITGEKLNQVFSHARLFCLPSFHEGLPIALLEAMSYGLPVIVSDITANKEVILPPERFFRCGEVAELRTKLDQFFDRGLSATEQHDYKQQLSEKYNWRKIADQTISVYEKILA